MRTPLATLFALLALLAPALSGCGDDDQSPGEIATDIAETVERGVESVEEEVEDQTD